MLSNALTWTCIYALFITLKDTFQFGGVYCGAESIMPFVLKNMVMFFRQVFYAHRYFQRQNNLAEFFHDFPFTNSI